jgi:hypothetical protein
MMRPLTAFCLALAIPLHAAAQPVTPAPTTQEFTFGDQLVQSSLQRPDERTVRPRRTHAGPTLLRIRAHFVPEMLRSVERL